MNSFFRKAALGGAMLASLAVAATPAEARHRYYRHHDRTGTAIAAGVVGLAVGAALASNSRDRYYDRGHYYNDGYYNRGYYNSGYYDDGYYDRGYYPRSRTYIYYDSYPRYRSYYPRATYRDYERYRRDYRRWYRRHGY